MLGRPCGWSVLSALSGLGYGCVYAQMYVCMHMHMYVQLRMYLYKYVYMYMYT